MNRAVGDLLNIGPVTGQRLLAVGLGDEERLRAAGTEQAWLLLKSMFPKQISIVAAYAIEGALLEVHWRMLPPGRQAELKGTLT